MLRVRCDVLCKLSVDCVGIAFSSKRNPKKNKNKNKNCTQFTTSATLAIQKPTTMTWKMTTRNGKLATTCSCLNFDHLDTQQVSPCLMCTDRLCLADVAETVVLGAVEFGDRVE